VAAITKRQSPAWLLLAAAAATAACGPADPVEEASRRMTAELSARPFTVPDRTLTAHTGEPFELREETRGRFVLLFFGYTYCPDICPIQMATANAAFERLTPEERSRVVTLFVTMDPQRDSPERLASWLGAMRSPAVGLRASTTELEALLGDLGFVMPPMTSRQPLPGGGPEDYLVPHPTALFLITPDGQGRFQYGYERGTPDDIVEDLRILMALEWDLQQPLAASPDGETLLSVEAARLVTNPMGERIAVYGEIRNGSAREDTLVALHTGLAGSAGLHEMVERDGMMTMVPTSGIAVPAGGSVELRSGGLHGMLEELERVPEVDEIVVVSFVFASGAALEVPVRAVPLTDMVPRR
jgi:protein SCO1/2